MRQLIGLKTESGSTGVRPCSHLHLLIQALPTIEGNLERIATGRNEIGAGEAGQIDVDPQTVQQAVVKFDLCGGGPLRRVHRP